MNVAEESEWMLPKTAFLHSLCPVPSVTMADPTRSGFATPRSGTARRGLLRTVPHRTTALFLPVVGLDLLLWETKMVHFGQFVLLATVATDAKH